MAHMDNAPLTSTVFLPLSWFQVKITLGWGFAFFFFLFFFLKIKMSRERYGNEQVWLFCARFMEFSKFEVSRNSGFKHQQEFPLQISAWLNDYQALQYLSAGLPLRKVAELRV